MCIPLRQERDRICAELGDEHDECKKARLLYAWCEIARSGRMSDTRADDRMMALMKLLEEAVEAIFGKLDVPPRPCGKASVEARVRMFADKGTAMIFSRKMAEAFAEARITLGKNETYACAVCVVDKPKTVSRALATDPFGINRVDSSLVNYIMEPAIMKAVMRHAIKDKIEY